MKRINLNNESTLTTIALIVGAILVFGSIIYTSRLHGPETLKSAEVENGNIKPTPTATSLGVKLKPQQKLIAPPISNQSGPPTTLYAKTSINIYQSESDTSPVLDTVQQGTYWEFPYTPKGSWYTVSTSDKKQGYIKASDMTNQKPDSPAHCDLVYTFKLGRVEPYWKDNGYRNYDETKLITMLKRAAGEWNTALDKNILQYDPNSPNTVDFVSTTAHQEAVDDNNLGWEKSASYPNGTKSTSFHIDMISYVFRWPLSNRYYDVNNANPNDFLFSQNPFDFLVEGTMIHELGHAFGMSHDQQNPLAIMSATISMPFVYTLAQSDKNQARDWCNK
jgi:archaellum component FlaF (FlaF/FlaG flagellin family)